jgi:hypothetical protein
LAQAGPSAEQQETLAEICRRKLPRITRHRRRPVRESRALTLGA